MYATLTIEAIDYTQEIELTPEQLHAELVIWAQQVVLSVEDNVSTVVAEFFIANYVKGEDGNTPYIGENGNWWVDGEDTGKPSRGEKGEETIVIIGENGNWFIDGVDTGKPSRGDKGDTPLITIGLNGNWYVDGVDTGTKAQGADGETPVITIGENGNWYINGVDTGVKAQGNKGDNGTSAYAIYVAGGGTLSEADYNASITNIPTHIADATKHIDTTTDEFSGEIDETNDKLTIWDNSLLKWIRFSFTSLKTYLGGVFLRLDQTTPQTQTHPQIITSLVKGKLTYTDSNGQMKEIDAIYDPVKLQIQIGGETAFSNAYGLIVKKRIGCSTDIVTNGGLTRISSNGLFTNINGVFQIINSNTGANSAIEIWTKNIKAATFTPTQGVEVVSGIKFGDDTSAASADKVGTIRTRPISATEVAFEFCRPKADGTGYEWKKIKFED